MKSAKVASNTMRRTIRKLGIPSEMRGRVWQKLIEQMLGDRYDAEQLLQEAAKTIEQRHEPSVSQEITATLRQIEQDVDRTMPGNSHYEDGAEGGVKLRRILVAYSVHINQEIGELGF